MRAFFRSAWSSFATRPCGRTTCASCPVANRCLDKFGISKPIPGALWSIFAVSLAFPLWFYTHPYQFEQLFLRDIVTFDVSEERKRRYQDIIQKVGVSYPNKVSVVETNGVGPFCVGTNSKRGAVIFIPRELADYSDPEFDFLVKSKTEDGADAILFEGKIRDLPEELRIALLEETATLLPSQDEFDFVIGHEAGHILNNDHRHTTLMGLGAACCYHLMFKLWNNLLHYKQKQTIMGLPQLRSRTKHVFFVGVLSTLTVGISNWLQEKQADITSASKLHLEEPACRLAEKKIRQNQVLREVGGAKYITKGGIDLTQFSHPPPTYQKKYLEALLDENEKNQASVSNNGQEQKGE